MIVGARSQCPMSLAHSRRLVRIQWAPQERSFPWQMPFWKGIGQQAGCTVLMSGLSKTPVTERVQSVAQSGIVCGHTPGDFCVRYVDSHTCPLVKHVPPPSAESALSRGRQGHVRPSGSLPSPPASPSYLASAKSGGGCTIVFVSVWHTSHARNIFFLSARVCQTLSPCVLCSRFYVALLNQLIPSSVRSWGRFRSIPGFPNTDTEAQRAIMPWPGCPVSVWQSLCASVA